MQVASSDAREPGSLGWQAVELRRALDEAVQTELSKNQSEIL